VTGLRRLGPGLRRRLGWVQGMLVTVGVVASLWLITVTVTATPIAVVLWTFVIAVYAWLIHEYYRDRRFARALAALARRSDLLGGWERMNDAQRDEWFFDLCSALHDEQDGRC
jgi:hypothetical protein